MIDFGTIRPGTTLYIPFATYDSNDPAASVTITGLATTDIEIYRDGGTTTRASDNGYALLGTDGIDEYGTGIHGISVNLADNSDAQFFRSGSQYWVVIASITVDAGTINFIAATFRIGYQNALINTRIATLSTQTSFTLDSGPAEDNALVGYEVIIHDIASAVQCSRAVISAYTGATKTVTLAAAPTFTIAQYDNISIMGPSPLMPTTAGRTLDVSAGGEAGIDWANVGSPTSTVGLTNTTLGIVSAATLANGAHGGAAATIQFATSTFGATSMINAAGVGLTVTGSTIGMIISGQAGEGAQFTSAGGDGDAIKLKPNGTGLAINADGPVTVTGAVTASNASNNINLGTGTITAGVIANAAIDNATFAADVGSTAYATNIVALAVRKALDAINLDHLVAIADSDDVADNSIIAKLACKTYGTADWTTYDNTTDSQEAIRDRGDLAWATGAGAGADLSYTPSGAPTFATGTVTYTGGSGDYTNMVSVDDTTMNVQEATPTNPGIDGYVPFAAAAGVYPVSLRIWGYYSGNSTHWIQVQAAVGGVVGTWETIGTISNGTAVTPYAFPLTPQHINAGTGAAYIRFLHNSVNGIGTHYLYIDKMLFTAQTPVDVTSQVTDALNSYDPPTNTEMVAAFTEVKGATWSASTDTLEAIRDRGDAAWITATGFSTLDAAGIRTAVGLASANLDTQLTAIVEDTGTTLNDLLDKVAVICIGDVTDAGTGTEVFTYGGVTATVTVDEDGNRTLVFS